MNNKAQVGFEKVKNVMIILVALGFIAFIAIIVLTSLQSTEGLQSSGGVRSDLILSQSGDTTSLAETAFSWISATVFNRTWLGFDGTDDYVNVTDSDSLSNTTEGITVAMWINPATGDFAGIDGTDSFVHFAGKANVGNNIEYKFRIYNETNSAARPNRISFYYFNLSGGLGVGSYFQDAPSYGDWIHVVGVMNGTDTLIYSDGTFRDSDPLIDLGITPENGDASFKIGTGELEDEGFFNGSIDEVRIYNTTLSNAEITAVFATGRVHNVTPLDSDVGVVVEEVLQANGSSHSFGSVADEFNNATYKNRTWLEFDGVATNDIDVDGLSPSAYGTNYTMSIWFNVTGSDTAVLMGSNLNFRTFGIHEGSLRLRQLNDSIGETIMTSSVLVNDSAWHHGVATYNAYDGNITLYLDGVVVNSSLIGVREAASGNSNFQIGGAGTSVGLSAGSYIDEVRLYYGTNPILSQSEIVEINNSGRFPNESLPTTGLLMWFSFDEDSGTTAFTKSIGNNGTLNGGITYVNDLIDVLVPATSYTATSSTFTTTDINFAWTNMTLTYTEENRNANQVLYMSLNENQNLTTYDFSSQANNGTIIGGTYANDGINNPLTLNVDYNQTDSNFTLINSQFNWNQVTANYDSESPTSKQTTNILNNITGGFESFFSNASTWFALLAIVVIILMVVIIMKVVNKFDKDQGAL